MKTKIIYKSLLISILIFLPSILSAECPLKLNLKTTDTGGCGSGTLGLVEFEATPETSGTILETYYLVYSQDGSTLINTAGNTNPSTRNLSCHSRSTV